MTDKTIFIFDAQEGDKINSRMMYIRQMVIY